jgi:hypothetical protein
MADIISAFGRRKLVEQLVDARPERTTIGHFSAWRSSAFSLATASSIGLKSGLYGGRYINWAP